MNNFLRNFIRKWLGINDDMVAVSQDIDQLLKLEQTTSTQLFGIFHALPFIANVLHLQARDAAMITAPTMVEANSLPVLLMGVTINARLGMSSFEVTGEIPAKVREALEARQFKVEEHEGTGGKSTFIIWT